MYPSIFISVISFIYFWHSKVARNDTEIEFFVFASLSRFTPSGFCLWKKKKKWSAYICQRVDTRRNASDKLKEKVYVH